MSRVPSTRLAGIVVVSWIVLEYILRHGGAALAGVLLDQPAIGDYLALAVGFPLIAVLLSTYALDHGQSRGDWEYDWSVRPLLAGTLATIVVFVLLVVTAQIDAALFDLDTQAAAVTEGLGATIGASPWVAVLLLVGNGLVAPIAEERVWRGIVQTEFVDAWGVGPGIAVTAALFALKHVVVDGSVARLTTLLALGVVFGLVRHRWGTASSTVTHVATNSLASASIIAVALYGPV